MRDLPKDMQVNSESNSYFSDTLLEPFPMRLE